MSVKPLSQEEYRTLVKGLAGLTESESRLNQYIERHFSELPYHSIVELAQNAEVSKATVGRFLCKIGFTGFYIFRQALSRGMFVTEIVPPYTKQSLLKSNEVTSADINVQNFTSQINELMLDFKANISIVNLENLVSLLVDENRPVYVVGPASSHALALHFSTLMKYFRNNITLLSTDTSALPKDLVCINENDILIVFSYYRYNRVALKIAGWFRKKKATVVLVTNSVSNPYGKFCDWQFVLRCDVDGLFQSRIPGFVFIELVLHLVSLKHRDTGNLAKLEELFEYFDTFSVLQRKL